MLTVNPTPFIGAILGSTSLATGSSTTLSNAVSGGTWVSSNPSVASISTTGVITGIAAGTATITYTLTNSFGCSSDTTTSLTIVPATSIEQLTTQPKFSLFPNPTMGGVTINWQGLDAEETNVTITDAAGRIIIQEVIPVVAASGNHHVDLSNFAPGMYFFMVSTGTTTFNDRIMLQ
jgi:hypothetical protein